MEHARPPAELVLEGGPANRADTWRKWLKQFKVFLKASGVYKEAKDVQASLLINLIGADGYDIYSTFKIKAEGQDDDIDVLIQKFNEHFGTKTNTTMARFRFFTRNQMEGENIDAYVTALRLLCQHCEFEHLEGGLIRDRIVCGVTDTGVRDRLLRTDELTLEKAVKICQASEVSSEENRHIEKTKSKEQSGAIDALLSTRAPRRSGAPAAATEREERGRARAAPAATNARRAGASGWRRHTTVSSNRGFDYGSSRETVSRCCSACGGVHDDNARCPARFAKCFLCFNKGHFKNMCTARGKRVHEIQESGDSENEFYYVSSLGQTSQSKDSKWFERLNLAENEYRMSELFKLDTGSDLNVLSVVTFKRLGFTIKDIKPCSIRAQSFCGNYIEILGTRQMLWSFKNKNYLIDFVISNHRCQSVLGKYTCEELGLIKRVFALKIENYEDLFHGVGKLPGKYKIILENNASPSVCPVRKIPLGIRDKLKTELDKMEHMGIIRKVSHPTEWVNAIVLPAKKDGGIRVCLDPRPLNRAVRRAHYPLPTLTEIAAKLTNARYFSKLDARSGFWMIELDDDSADLCTFGTPFGRYKFLRLPYGINCASEVFHSKIRQLLEDLDGVDSFIDDVIIWGRTKEEHDERLIRLLDRAREVGIKFNRDKCEFCVEQVTYLGHVFSEKGMQIDTNKIKAIMDMPEPRDRPSLERFLGMINYLSKFIPNYSQMAGPLRGLLKKGNEWVWDSVHQTAVHKLKQAVCSAPVLALYSSERPVVITVDASSTAIGAALLQDGRPVEFSSLTMTDTQKRYAQIEKEMLAIVFAMEKYHQYVYGKQDVIVETDHKPLEALFKKSLDAVPVRLQRMMLRVQRYEFTVVYKPGKYMYVADALSRAALPELMHDRVTCEVEDQACFLIANTPFSDSKLTLVREATQRDQECELIRHYILAGWPRYKKDLHDIVKKHWSYKEELQLIDGVIFKNHLVYIPRELRGEMISRVHEGHLGIDRCKRRARDVMFWNGMSRDVEQTVRACATCAEHAARNVKEPMIPHSIPDSPWRKVGADLFFCDQKNFLIIVDYFSNYIEITALRNIGSRVVIEAMKDQFARHGIPMELITDNGPAFRSREFKKFAEDWCFTHTTSSPNYPQSNGLSERAVRTVKGIIKKSLCTGTDYYLGLLNFRSTPRDGISSPSQLLMGRRLNTRLPVHTERLKPERNNKRDFENIVTKRVLSKKQYDMHARELPALKPGQKVIVTDDDKRRRHMQVQAPAPQPRSYFLTDSSGRRYRRNRRHILKDGAEDAAALPASKQGKEDSGSEDNERTSTYSDAEESMYEGLSDSYRVVDRSASSSPNSNRIQQTRAASRRARERLALFFKK